MKILRAIYTGYGVIVFTLLFIIFFLLLLIPIALPKHFKLIGILNRWWAKTMFALIALPFEVTYRVKLDKKKQYIFCPNHFSYLDIPSVALNDVNTIFVGKNDMEKIPFFGFMYRKLHITVDRSKLKSRYSTMVRTLQAIDEGKSLVIFPEGGIVSEHGPGLAPFKDGAFRASIEKQIPIVPITIPFNWIILPANEFLLRWKTLKVIFHEPIDPKEYSMKDVRQYKERVRNIIDEELKRQMKNEN